MTVTRDQVLKGAFYTPKIWVDKSQEYLTRVFGEDWQDNYYIWDCAAGIGNLLIGLKNKNNIWASTIDYDDIPAMYARIDSGELCMEKDHIFQFDFLNDSFDKLPEGLRDVILDPEKQKKLIMYINPPYGDIGTGIGSESKTGLAKGTLVYKKVCKLVGPSATELSVLFIMRILSTVPKSTLAMFNTPKYFTSPHYSKFRQYFLAEYKGGFFFPADTFKGVTGTYAICFLIWDLSNKERTVSIDADLYTLDRNQNIVKENTRTFQTFKKGKTIVFWIRTFIDSVSKPLAFVSKSSTVQNQGKFAILSTREMLGGQLYAITWYNILHCCVLFSVGLCEKLTWLNNYEQFLFPKEDYLKDIEFQKDCLVYTLFHNKNRLCSKEVEVNYFIPFTQEEVGAKYPFKSKLMSIFIKKREPFSEEAQSVLKAGKLLWKYYHNRIKNDDNALVDASFYEIKEYFKGRTADGRLNAKSKDEVFNKLYRHLTKNLRKLESSIRNKVYLYGFLRKSDYADKK